VAAGREGRATQRRGRGGQRSGIRRPRAQSHRPGANHPRRSAPNHAGGVGRAAAKGTAARQHAVPTDDEGSVADAITAWEERLPRRTGWRTDERGGFLALFSGQTIEERVALQRWTGRITVTLSQAPAEIRKQEQVQLPVQNGDRNQAPSRIFLSRSQDHFGIMEPALRFT